MTPEERDRVWEDWLSSRPAHVAEVARKWPPWECAILAETGQHCWPVSYSEEEDGSVTLKLHACMPLAPPCHEVWGILPSSLLPCGCGLPCVQQRLGPPVLCAAP